MGQLLIFTDHICMFSWNRVNENQEHDRKPIDQRKYFWIFYSISSVYEILPLISKQPTPDFNDVFYNFKFVLR